MTMTPTDILATVKAALAKMTPGELSWAGPQVTLYAGRSAGRHGYNLLGRIPDPSQNYANDLNGIVAVMNAAPALLADLAAERIENTRLREAFVTMEKAANQREAEVERLTNELERQGQQDTHISTLMRELAKAREEIERLNSPVLKSEWQQMETGLAALRERHDLDVLMAWHEGEKWGESHRMSLCTDRNAAWLASSAKAALEGKP
jgi:hypothetical protein